MPTKQNKTTFGLIVGNRGFFPDHLAAEGRAEMIAVLEAAGVKVIAPSPNDSKFGAVETHEEARKCAQLFRAHRDDIDGVVVTLPNFGDEALPISAAFSRARRRTTSRPSSTRCGWRTCGFPCWFRRLRIRPRACRSATAAIAFAARCRPATTCGNTAFRIR